MAPHLHPHPSAARLCSDVPTGKLQKALLHTYLRNNAIRNLPHSPTYLTLVTHSFLSSIETLSPASSSRPSDQKLPSNHFSPCGVLKHCRQLDDSARTSFLAPRQILLNTAIRATRRTYLPVHQSETRKILQPTPPLRPICMYYASRPHALLRPERHLFRTTHKRNQSACKEHTVFR